MNIFYLDNDTKTCAEYHNDKHVVKMILEYAQLLSTAHRILDGRETIGKSKTGRNVKRFVLDNDLDSIVYSATHVSHPSAVWVRKSFQNYLWLTDLLNFLCLEYTHRYGKVHKVESDGLLRALLIYHPHGIGFAPFTEPTPAMPDDCKVPGDSIASYRNYYINNKTHIASWSGKIAGRNPPAWYTGISQGEYNV